MNHRMRILLTNLVVIVSITLQSCSYSFSGASVPAHLKTVFITVFQDRSGSGEFNLGDRVSKQLIQKFIEDNTLAISDRTNANAIVDGSISVLNDTPASIGGGEKITSRRITLTVQVTYKDLVLKKTIFDRSFSNYGDYSAGGDITKARTDAINLAIDKITEDIVLGVVSNW
jgi:hypothetical protein